MNIQTEKLELLKRIIDTENPNILAAIKNVFIQDAKEDFWEKLPPYQKEEILQGIQEIKSAAFVDYDDFMKKHR
jgi:hypothetical protein